MLVLSTTGKLKLKKQNVHCHINLKLMDKSGIEKSKEEEEKHTIKGIEKQLIGNYLISLNIIN